MDRIDIGGLKIARSLHDFMAREALPATGIDPQAFWTGLGALVRELGPENRELLRLVLTEAGLVMTEAENGQVAVDKTRAEAFDIVLMDMQMPVMDGHTAARIMRSEGVTVPIFALTANAMKGAEKDVMDAGCSGFLTKPINIDQLMETLAALLGGTRITAPIQGIEQATQASIEAIGVAASPRSEATAAGGGSFATQESAANAVSHASPQLSAAVPPLSGPPVRSRLADKPRLRSAVRKFAGRLDEQMAVIEKAFESRAFDELAALAHWLKGAAGTVGYDDFTEPAMRLEEEAHAQNTVGLEATMAEIRDLVTRLEVPAEEPVAAAVS